MEYTAQCGDIFLCDSNKTGAKIVKFLQQAPTIWQWIWRQIRHTQEPVRYYHAGMILSDEQMIEQQWKVQYGDTQKILSRKIIIYRYKNNNPKKFSERYFQRVVKSRAEEDLGKIYDIPQLIGKTLTWLTGIKLFVRLLGGLSKEEEICVTRIGDWYEGICNFGVKTRSEITTKIIDEYCQNHPEEWEIVYQNN
jgi:hypothetical protein